MAHIFEPEILRDIVRMHLHLPIEDQIGAVSRTLKDVYGEHVSMGEPWMWSTAGGIMCAISPLHVSINEYLLFCGTAIGSEGHSGRHRADIYDVVMNPWLAGTVLAARDFGKIGLPETLGVHAWILIPVLAAVFIACFRLFERLERRG